MGHRPQTDPRAHLPNSLLSHGIALAPLSASVRLVWVDASSRYSRTNSYAKFGALAQALRVTASCRAAPSAKVRPAHPSARSCPSWLSEVEGGALEGRGRGTLEELLGAKPELLEPSERRKLDPSDVLGFLLGRAFGATVFAGFSLMMWIARTNNERRTMASNGMRPSSVPLR